MRRGHVSHEDLRPDRIRRPDFINSFIFLNYLFDLKTESIIKTSSSDFGPPSSSGSRSSSSPNQSAAARPNTDGASDLLLENSYYNFYQPSIYPTYYGNFYNYQQYQVTQD